jgi:hypothetical protein
LSIADISELAELSMAAGKTLQQFITEFITELPPNLADSPILNLSYRFAALSKFKSAINKPINSTWLLLFLHLLIYEDVAKKFPAACGLVPGTSIQNLEKAVNEDLTALLKAKTGNEPTTNKLKTIKVHFFVID